MKSFIAIFSFVMSLSVSASSFLSFEELYKTLGATEIEISYGEGAEIWQKALAGIACKKVSYVFPGSFPVYNCVISTDDLDSGELYHLLNVKEVIDAQGEGAVVSKKSIRGLVCTKTEYVLPDSNPDYLCSMNLKF